MSTYYLVSLWKSLITKDFFRILGNNHSFSHPYYQFFLSYICTCIYVQGRPSSQCHRAMALVVFCPAQKVRAYFGRPVTKSLDSPKWHWLIFVPMGALSNIVKGQANSHIKATGRTLSVGFIFSWIRLYYWCPESFLCGGLLRRHSWSYGAPLVFRCLWRARTMSPQSVVS